MDPIFQNHELAVTFHPYQQEAITTLLTRYEQGQRRLHLVAPPGSGKTLMGLELARRIGLRTVILSPTATIQHQWVQKFEQLAVDLEGLEGLESNQKVISTDPNEQPAILSLTYQKVSVKGELGLHNNVMQLFLDLESAGYRTLILDECHHLLAHWAEAVRQFGSALPDTILLGLTATPPLGRQDRELAVYLDLIGEVDYEIPTPAVVREGHLAPFQDLVYLICPTESETQFISGAHRDLHQVLNKLEATTSAGSSLSIWAEDWLLHPLSYKGEDLQRSEALSKMPDRTIACLRYLNQRGLVPLDAPWCPELEDLPELADLANLLGGYGQAVLAEQHPQDWVLVRHALEQLGYRFQQGQFRLRQGAIDRVLALSAAKLRAVEHILKQEMSSLDTELRCLILTDFETTHAPGRRAATQGVLDPEAGGALAVMRYLTSNTELDALDPILVTGKTLLCDDDLLPVFLAEAKTWFQEHHLSAQLKTEAVDGFVRILGSGRDWTSATYLGLVTDLLERGISRCLIGTRGLLGEGWDCKTLNTLIDLTAVSSFVSVNQMRGRTLRKDPHRPLKIANNWDVVALMPELEGGFRDLDRFERKHENFFGLSDDGHLEKGAGHVHPGFERLSRQALLAEMQEINTKMLEKASDRSAVYALWKVGEPYRNRTLSALHIQLPKALPAVAQQQVTAPVALQTLPVQVETAAEDITLRIQSQKKLLNAMFFSSILGGIGLVFANPLQALIWLLCSQGFFWGWKARQQSRIQIPVLAQASSTQLPLFLQALADVILLSFQEQSEDPQTENEAKVIYSQRTDGSFRLSLSDASPAFSEQYMQALRECLEPLQEQRYILAFEQNTLTLVTQKWSWPELSLTPVGTAYLPLPRYFARSRERAELFGRFFEANIATAELIYTRKGQGQQQMQKLQRQRALWSRQKAIEIWE